jgi:hypothetical protein
VKEAVARNSQREAVMRRDFMRAVRELWRTFGGAFDAYRPERHYMRGPGPKCHAKRAGLMTQTAAATAATGTDFAHIHG